MVIFKRREEESVKAGGDKNRRASGDPAHDGALIDLNLSADLVKATDSRSQAGALA